MIPDLVGREPVGAFSIDQAAGREAREEIGAENLVERPDGRGRDEDADVSAGP